MDHLTRRTLIANAAGAALLPLSSALAAPGDKPRTSDSFDFDWRFFKGDAPGAQSPEFADSAWRAVDLPHDWSIEGPFSEKEPTAGPGGYLPTGIGWYRKRFRLPDTARDRKVFVEFDGVYENSEVWINGRLLGKRPYGYAPFHYDLTPHLRFGADNVIAVKADNSKQPNTRWYTGSGIYRSTRLLITNKVHVAPWGTYITTPQFTADSALVQVKTRVANEAASVARCTLETTILDKEGKPVQTATANQDVLPSTEYEFVQQVKLDKPTRWSSANPYLYTVKSTVRDQAGVTLDEYETPLGVREILFDADRGFLLNGERVKLNGVCVHHDGGAVGAAVPKRVWERRFEILKEMGCNSIRTSHNPPSAEFLDLCDRMGMLVMHEAFDEWKSPKPQGPYMYHLYFDEWAERDLKAAIHRDRNHPSIVIWSAGNEIGDQSAPNGAETLRKLTDIFHTEDPTRPVTVGCDRIESEPVGNRARPEFLETLDVVGYNYVDRWRDRNEKYYSIDRHAHPRWKVIGTESPSMGGVRGEYGGGFGFGPPPPAGAPPRRPSGPRTDVEQLWKFVRTYDYVAGDYMWTGIDYLGEARWPTKNSSAGVIDTCGFPKDGYYFYQSQWTTKPMLHLFPHWNWKGREGQFLPVFCYTNCDSVELFLNGRSIGVKGYQFPRVGMSERYGNYPPGSRGMRTTSDLHLSWDVPYEPGTLRAVGTKGGQTVMTVEIATTGEPAAIALSVDRNAIAADRRDVAHIEARIVDSQGRVVPEADAAVTFEVGGAGKLIGVDNGNPASHEDYKVPQRRAFHGLCLAMVQSTALPGNIQVTATSPGLKPATVTVLVGQASGLSSPLARTTRVQP